MNRLATLICSFGVSFIAIGCGSDGRKYTGALQPVSGKVTLHGKPVPAGWVTFNPDPAKGNKFSGGDVAEAVIENGRYTIDTGGRVGAPSGWYKVTVATIRPGMSKEEEKLAVPIPRDYQLPDKTSLTFEVKDGGGNYDVIIK